jgi:phosphatidylserine decarboxylase
LKEKSLSAISKTLILPKSLLSFAVGFLARLYIPGVSKILNFVFVKIFAIEMAEASKPLGSYKTVEDIFTRKLKSGERTLEAEPLSPADGTLSISKPVVKGMAVQAKGIDYSVSELVFGNLAPKASFNAEWFTTVYLAPHNYHRVHSPVSGTITEMRYIPGELWPVNKPAVSFVPRLFCRNERLVFTIETDKGKVHAVMVGALNVARMVTDHWPGLVTHAMVKATCGKVLEKKGLKINLNAGDELGTFMLGSTVVVVFENGTLDTASMEMKSAPEKILMGKTLLKK